ncbi:MAG: DNA double-strand break repair nuclease NurA [Ignisphaera sp.]
MLTQTLDATLLRFGFLRNKIDEVVSQDVVRSLKNIWIRYRVSINPYIKKLSIGGIDSSYNYIEYRGFALYVVNTVSVILDIKREEIVNGNVDVDVVTSPNLEHELSLLSMCMEIEAMNKMINDVDIVLIDGNLTAMFFKLYKASIDDGYEILESRGISISKTLKELVYTIALNPRKIVFISKNSNSKDLLGLVKGDIYYFERYTEFVSGFTKPIDLANSQHLGMASIARLFKQYTKKLTGLDVSIMLTYVRFEDFSRVYRIEFASDSVDEAIDRVKYIVDSLSDVIVSGYPYPLIRAHNLAKISNSDVERVAILLGISKDPRTRESFLR